MSREWTSQQKSVIDFRGGTLLVGAAAGSGKTAVLTERILSLILDPVHPTDIDRILVVTFTNAAAQEMKTRIRAALMHALEQDPSNERIMLQTSLLGHAHISTIHSFCLDVIRSGFDRIGLDPSFRIAEEGEMKLMRMDVAGTVIEEAYAAKEEGFLLLSSCMAPGRDDHILEELLLSCYEFSSGYPDPKLWRRRCADAFLEPVCESDWMKALFTDAIETLSYAASCYEEALTLCELPDGPYYYAPVLSEELAAAKKALCAAEYDTLKEALDGVSFARLSAKKDAAVSDEQKERVKALRDEAKAVLTQLKERFVLSADDLARWQKQQYLLADALVRLTDAFDAAFTAKRRQMGILDFHDLEQCALAILTDGEGENRVPSALAGEFAAGFAEVMIDEYQDSNLVQELILQSVSGRGKKENNLFLVGDVKQSIYRFRLARPELFLEKYHTFQALTSGETQLTEGGTYRIDLNKNFRSRPQVLTFVNRIFAACMRPEIGGILYDDNAALYPGAAFPEADASQQGADARQDPYTPELWILNRESPEQELQRQENSLETPGQEADEEEKERSDRQAEAMLCARRIREMVGRFPVTDSETGTTRPAGYGDIAVLMRSPSGWVDTFLEVFQKQGIPAISQGATGYFDAPEVRCMLSLLSVLDNPRQDIPLGAVLFSPIGGLTAKELAAIRIAAPEGDLWDACVSYAAREDALAKRLCAFLDQIHHLRELARFLSLQELLETCLDETGYLTYVLAMQGGERRAKNLTMLIERARAYESGSYHGLFRFVRYIESLKKYEIDYGEALPDAGSGAVHLLSIHKSKGLEYPIVLVAGMGKQFNFSDAKGALVMHPELGIGMDLIDPDLRVRMSGLKKQALARALRKDTLGEELRILYVAMTRAREKLILIGSVKNLTGKQNQWERSVVSADADGRLSTHAIASALSYLDWVMPALSTGQPAQVSLTFADPDHPGEGTGISSEAGQSEDGHTGGDNSVIHSGTEEPVSQYLRAREWLDEIRAARDPYAHVRDIPGKVSVSLLKHLHMTRVEAQMEELFPEEVSEKAPEMESQSQTLTGAERGTVYHKVMEHLVFSEEMETELDPERAEKIAASQLERLEGCGKIRKDERAAVEIEALGAFLRSDLSRRMARAGRTGRLHRESPFVLGVPAKEINDSWTMDETVLVQGIIDVWFEEEDGIVLLDYKTDHVGHGGLAMLAEKYRAQLAYYQKALEQLTELPVKECWIYSFAKSRAVRAMQSQ